MRSRPAGVALCVRPTRRSRPNEPTALYAQLDLYLDGRYAPCNSHNQDIRDLLTTAVCWQNVQPSDSLKKHSTCYGISQRAWRIICEEMGQIACHKEWWRSAVRRIAVELFSGDPDQVERRFANLLKSASAIDHSSS